MSWRSRQTSSPPLAPPTFKSEILFQNFTPGVTNVESIRRDSAQKKCSANATEQSRAPALERQKETSVAHVSPSSKT